MSSPLPTPGWSGFRLALFVVAMSGVVLGVAVVVAVATSRSGVFGGGLVAAVGATVAHRVWCHVRGRPSGRRWEDRRPGPLG